MTDTGHVSAGKQIQSPASAGSRGLAKTTQFTNDRTQMQMGNSPIAESMIEIRNIMNRIDGINVPTNEMNELADDEKMEFTKILLDISAIKDRIERLSVDDDAKKSAIQSLTNAEEALVALDEHELLLLLLPLLLLPITTTTKNNTRPCIYIYIYIYTLFCLLTTE